VLRFLLWRVLGVVAATLGACAGAWLLGGGLGRALRGSTPASSPGDGPLSLVAATLGRATSLTRSRGFAGVACGLELLVGVTVAAASVLIARGLARRGRRYVRLQVVPYRADRTTAEAVARLFDALQRRLQRRWWRRLLLGQPSVSLEVHYEGETADGETTRRAWLAVVCPLGTESMVQAALRSAYPNCRLRSVESALAEHAALLRLKKSAAFIRRVKALDRFEHEREPPMNHLLVAMAATRAPALVQLAMTPTPACFERLARRAHERRERRAQSAADGRGRGLGRTMVEEVELRGGLDVQHRALFFLDLRVAGPDRATCERIASELRAEGAENRLVERGTAVRHGLLKLYTRRLAYGEGNVLPSLRRNVFAATELAALWQLPSTDFAAVPLARAMLPVAPAPPGILRPHGQPGTLRDALGPVSIPVDLRRQNTAVPGTVEQGKTSYLIATVAEDLRRERCAVIVLDPKGDAADAALSVVPAQRTCTLLDFAYPTCGFNPLAVNAPADVIADYVVAALKNLFTDADIRASSDRYLRNAIIAVLAYDRRASLWDAARLLSVGEEGYAYRRAVGAYVRTLPEFKEVSDFYTAELTAQLADARGATTSKLDAPVNKLARLLNSASIKRVLLNSSLRVDFEQIIAGGEVLIVRGALGVMGAGNTSVLMQLLVGMLDAALARQQDLMAAGDRTAVALKIDEAPLVLNRGFADTIALKRSAGLETVACWQTDGQWVDRDVREQLDALFAHRVYFATASTSDARAAASLTMAEFSDTVRPETRHLSALGHPDVRLHLPKHHAVASWVTADGRQQPFIARTIRLRVERARLQQHAEAQYARGARHLTDLTQPHWASADAHARSPARGETQTVSAVPRRHALKARAPASPGEPVASKDARPTALPPTVADSFAELVDMDRAQSVRVGRRAAVRPLEPDPLDLEVLALVATLGHVLTSQLHRRFNPERAATTTQRRLKRLSDAGLLDRFQFHRRDGGGVPMCHVVTDAGRQALREHGIRSHVGDGAAASGDPGENPASGARRAAGATEPRLREVRANVHAAGWALAFAATLSHANVRIRGKAESVLTPPAVVGKAREGLSPAALRLPGGRAPHDFLHTAASGERVEVERFETVRPNATLEVRLEHRTVDLLVELDDRARGNESARKLERYDHFLAGWSLHTRRYGPREGVTPAVVFVCRDRSRARRAAEDADAVLGACRAYAGEHPADWQFPGRDRIRFVAERDVHEGVLDGVRLSRLPPHVRVRGSRGDPRAGETRVLACSLLDLWTEARA
jgi:Replication-relaxation